MDPHPVVAATTDKKDYLRVLSPNPKRYNTTLFFFFSFRVVGGSLKLASRSLEVILRLRDRGGGGGGGGGPQN